MCTKDDFVKLTYLVNKSDVIDSFARESKNTKRSFYKLTKLTRFAAFLEDVPTGCKDAVLHKPLLNNSKNHKVIYLTFEENTRQPYHVKLCLFGALALHLHGNQELEEQTSKMFIVFINRMDGLSPRQFGGVHKDDISVFRDLLQLNFFIFEIHIVDGKILGESARRSVQNYENTVRLLRYNDHICYVSIINAVF